MSPFVRRGVLLSVRTLHLFARLFTEGVCCACVGPLCVRALHLIARAVPVHQKNTLVK